MKPRRVFWVTAYAAGLLASFTLQAQVVSDPPPQSVVTIHAVDPYASEMSPILPAFDAGVFEIRRSGPTNIDLLVYYRVRGTAIPGRDYQALSNSVVIPSGKRAAVISVLPRWDDLIEPPETVVIRLEPIACIAIYPPPPECYLVGQPNEAVVFIRDGSPPNAPPKVAILQPAPGTAFPEGTSVKIFAETVDPDGYAPRVIFFADGTKIGEQTLVFVRAPDPGTPLQFEMIWVNPPPGRHVLTAKTIDSRGMPAWSAPVEITVGEDDPPPTLPPPIVRIVATDPIAIEGTNCWSWPSFTNPEPEGSLVASSFSPEFGPDRIWWFTNCGPKSATFTIRRTGDTNAEFRLFYSVSGLASNGVDFEKLSGSVYFEAGQRVAHLPVVPLDDPVLERPETVIIKLLPSPAAVIPPPYLVGFPPRAAAVIFDGHLPRIRSSALADRCFHLATLAPDGSWHRIDFTTDFKAWFPLCTSQAIQGAIHFVDPDAPDSIARFYRAVPTAQPTTQEW